MQKIIFSLFSLLTIICLTACNDDLGFSEELQPDSPGTITLRFQNTKMSRSAASDNSENKIERIAIGLYPYSADDDEKPVAWGVYSFEETYHSCTVTMKLTDDMIDDLFFGDNAGEMGGELQSRDLIIGGGGMGKPGCRVFALANVSLDDPNRPLSINEMKQLPVESPFATVKVQESFVMTGEGEVLYDEPSDTDPIGKASGTIDLLRAAAKVRLNIKLPEKLEIKDANGSVVETWKPQTNENAISVLINNGVFKAIASPDAVSTGGLEPDPDIPDMPLMSLGQSSRAAMWDPWKPSEADAYYSSSYSAENSYRTFIPKSDGEATGGLTTYTMDVPFYTYPNAWTESVDETHKTTLTLMVPWKKDGSDGEFTHFYYQVPTTEPDFTWIGRNEYIDITLTVGMLGTREPGEDIELEPSYTVVDWGSAEIETPLNEIRYLVVTPSVYTVNNSSIISIPFYTSHPTEITDITMWYQRFNYPENNTGGVVDIPISKEVIDRSENTNKNKDIYTEKICDYEIVRDPISNNMTIQINHPMFVWTPRNEAKEEVKLIHVGKGSPTDTAELNASLAQTIKEIYFYDPPIINMQRSYFPYKFVVTVQHIDKKGTESFKETVEITQYPGMYIVDEYNPGGAYIGFNPESADHAASELINGWAFLNAAQEYYNGQLVWRNADVWTPEPDYPKESTDEAKEEYRRMYFNYVKDGLGGLRPWENPTVSKENVNNYNMYIINLTQLSNETDSYGERYVIGDPRAKFICNELSDSTLVADLTVAGDWCNAAKSVDGSIRKLTYYYPTDETDEKKMYVAPKLRISSAYGFVRQQTQIINKCFARRRCATYQERQFPAGRWRLPTYGEVSFICRLSEKGLIPTLFKIDMIYMTAQGAYYIRDGGKLEATYVGYSIYWSDREGKWQFSTSYSHTVNVRPVYDEWYWENFPDKGSIEDENGGWIYTLGDMPLTL